jgi:hypothetical protein
MPRLSVQDETVAPEPTSEFIEPQSEDDIVFGGMGVLEAESVKPKTTVQVEDEIPMGRHVTQDGVLYIDRVPAFLLNDRPVSNIR